MTEELYRLKLRTYRVIYKKEEDRLIILVVAGKSRENSYKKIKMSNKKQIRKINWEDRYLKW